MGREEKRRKFHEAILNTLYPPPPPPPQAVNEEEKPTDTLSEDFQVELINPDDYIGSSNLSGDDDDDEDDNVDGSECEPQKLTRAQRKRLRKKKLKEDASRRSKIIGPLLPIPNNDDGGGGNVSPTVRQNADEECAVTSDIPREIIGCSDQKKLKNRRKAKKLTRDRLKCSSSKENCSEDQKLKSPNETCDQAHHSCSQD